MCMICQLVLTKSWINLCLSTIALSLGSFTVSGTDCSAEADSLVFFRKPIAISSLSEIRKHAHMRFLSLYCIGLLRMRFVARAKGHQIQHTSVLVARLANQTVLFVCGTRLKVPLFSVSPPRKPNPQGNFAVHCFRVRCHCRQRRPVLGGKVAPFDLLQLQT